MNPSISILKTLTYRSFRQKKGRNFVAVIAILLTAMMFTTLFTLAQSMGQNMTEMYLRQSGTASHTSIKGITDTQIETLAAHPDVKRFGKSIVAGIAVNEALAGRQVEVRYATEQYAEDSFAKPTAGRLPQSSGEIALDSLTLERLGIPKELGQQVFLEWQKGLDSSDVISSSFTLCGWWEGNLSSYASMAWVSEDFVLDACGGAEESAEGQVCGLRMMGITFAAPHQIEEKTEKILSDSGISNLEFNPNLAYSNEIQQSILMENLPMYTGMMLVFIAGYFIIFNVFQISVASDIPFYGKLKTLGMTSKQLKKMIYKQGNWLSLLGIPAGLVIGYFLGVLLVPALLANLGAAPSVSANPIIFLGSALFAYITVITSCLLPARLAGKVSPMEALRYTDSDSGIRRKTKQSHNGASIFGMAWANLWRNKKRTVMVICSLTMGFVLMSFFYAQNASFDVEKYLMSLTVADYQIDDATNYSYNGYNPESRTISKDMLAEIDRLGTVEKTGQLFSHQTTGILSESACNNFTSFYTQERLDDYAAFDPTFPEWKKEYDQALAGEPTAFLIYGADGLILDAAADSSYLLNGEYDAEKFSTGEYVIAIGPSVEPGALLPTYSVGETVTIRDREFTVMAIVSPLSPMTAGKDSVTFHLSFIVPSDVFLQIWPDNTPRKFYFNVKDDGLKEASELLNDYKNNKAPGMNITSRQTIVEQYEAQTRSSAVMGYAISIVIALVGILNFVNSMVTAILSRKREFAMMQSIGMTKRQLRKMLTFEGLSYAGLACIASYGLGAFVVGVIVRSTASVGYSTFHFTLLPLVICTPILLAFAILIPFLGFKNVENQSIVERLRESDS